MANQGSKVNLFRCHHLLWHTKLSTPTSKEDAVLSQLGVGQKHNATQLVRRLHPDELQAMSLQNGQCLMLIIELESSGRVRLFTTSGEIC